MKQILTWLQNVFRTQSFLLKKASRADSNICNVFNNSVVSSDYRNNGMCDCTFTITKSTKSSRIGWTLSWYCAMSELRNCSGSHVGTYSNRDVLTRYEPNCSLQAVKSLEEKLLDRSWVNELEGFLYTEISSSLGSIIITPFCHSFVSPVTNITASCCTVTIGSEETGFCTYPKLFAPRRLSSAGLKIFNCKRGILVIKYSPHRSASCITAWKSSLTSRFLYKSEESPSGYVDTKRPSSDIEKRPSQTNFNDPGESDQVYVDLQSLECGGHRDPGLCTQYVSFLYSLRRSVQLTRYGSKVLRRWKEFGIL